MSTNANARRKAILEKRLSELLDEYEAAFDQIGRVLSDTDALKIKRQVDYLDEAIKEVEQQLAALSEGEGDGRAPAANDDSATADTAYLAKLTDILNARFNLGELNSLAFHLSLDLDDLPGEGKQRKAEELVKYLNRHERLTELVKTGKQKRPDINWPNR